MDKLTEKKDSNLMNTSNGKGLFGNGIVIAKNEYTPQGGTPRYSFDMAIPGSRQNLSINCEEDYWKSIKELDDVRVQLQVISIRGNLMFIKV